MVIVQISNGLGNQMFMYALGRSISYRNNVELKLDLSIYDSGHHSVYFLDKFNIQAGIATREEVESFKPKRWKLHKWIPYEINRRMMPMRKRKFVRERTYRFDPEVMKIRDNAYLLGFWACEKYFKDIREVLLQDFTLINSPNEKNREVLDEMASCDSISLHIRRGKYVSDPRARRTFGALPVEYYQRGLDYIAERVSNPRVFVFSHEMDWVKENLKTNLPLRYVDHNPPAEYYEDLRLIKACKHHVIPNSTFTWWGAWLCKYPGKIVVAPRYWFAPEKAERGGDAEVFPDEWIRL
jgi:hypothetical protein